MAILPGFSGLQADIIVNGARCIEYPEPADLNEDTPISVTKYIEAEDGANFVIQLRIDGWFKYITNNISAHIKVDGQVARRPLWLKPTTMGVGHPVRTIDGVELQSNNGWAKRKLVFSTLSIGNHD
jgi:hypothetical protein